MDHLEQLKLQFEKTFKLLVLIKEPLDTEWPTMEQIQERKYAKHTYRLEHTQAGLEYYTELVKVCIQELKSSETKEQEDAAMVKLINANDMKREFQYRI
jgi:hypothetical protein